VALDFVVPVAKVAPGELPFTTPVRVSAPRLARSGTGVTRRLFVLFVQ
jgi:hypothetical protein